MHDLVAYKRVSLMCKPDEHGCHVWFGGLKPNGYGYLSYKHHKEYAHRLMYVAVHGGVLTRHDVIMHTCDNRRCCNPDHLRLGTHAENSRDMARKRRGNKQILGLTQVRRIRRLLRLHAATSPKALAKRFGVSRSAIGHIAAGNSWRHS